MYIWNIWWMSMHVGWMSKVSCMFVPFIWKQLCGYAGVHLQYDYNICDHRRCASACVLMKVLPFGHNLSTYQILLRGLAWLACAITLMFSLSFSLSLSCNWYVCACLHELKIKVYKWDIVGKFWHRWQCISSITMSVIDPHDVSAIQMQ